MRVVAIKNPKGEAERRLIYDFHRLLTRIFRGRLAWKVRCTSGLEINSFDKLSPTYVLCLDHSDALIGCARLLPALGRTMLKEVFPQLLVETKQLPTQRRMMESYCFCVNTNAAAEREQARLHSANLALDAGIVEWSILNGYREIATATHLRLERTLHRTGWLLSSPGSPAQINKTKTVARLLPSHWQSFDRIRPGICASNFSHPETEAA